MPRRLLGVLILLLVSVSIGWAQGDAVLFTLGTDTVYCREFKYHWERSSEKRLDVFLQAYGRFKRKVQCAKELGLDTLFEYRLPKEQNRNLLRQTTEGRRNGDSFFSQEWVRLVEFTCPLRQQADKKQMLDAKAYMDSLYTSLKRGEDVGVQRTAWIQTRYLLNEWQEQLKELSQGEYSEPFYSPLGVHVIAWTDKSTGPFAGGASPEVEESFRAKEMEEGLLVALLNSHVERGVDCTEQELEAYFKEHRKDYGGGIPHYRGAVVHCQDKTEAKRIKKYLQKYPEEQWKEAWERMPEQLSKESRLEIGLFAIGKNPYVDKLVFKCGTFEPLAAYPYTWVLGKKLKKGPENFKDVRNKVYRDCKRAKKEAEFEALIQKYQVEIDEEVLKTVNYEGNK